MANKSIRLGEILLQYGYITETQLQEALEYQQAHKGMRIGQVLMELKYVTEKQVLQALSRRLDVQLVDISAMGVNTEAVQLIPQELAEKYKMLAVAFTDHTLTVVTNDPLNFYAQEDVRQLTGRQLIVCLSESAPLDRAIRYYYSDVLMRIATKQADTVRDVAADNDWLGTITDTGEGDAPIIKLLNTLIRRAYNVGASDIHIEPFELNTNVRMRIDGTIVDCVTLQTKLHAPLIARIKILSNLDIAERRVPQDGHFRFRLDTEDLNIRVSVIPTVFGEKAVMRLLSTARHIDNSKTFGMNEDNYKKFHKMLQSPNGIIYITGPTGSGKTTTLYMVLESLSDRRVNITTIEDPVEKNLPKINQTQVNNTAGLTFDVGMRALLRQDPDIIMVGETRDIETADTSVRAAITGHLVFSTMHTNNAVSSIIRLADMGVESYMIANSLVGVVAQRLVRKVCPDCAVDSPVKDEERYLVGNDIQTIKRAVGCAKCNNTGYAGRTAVHEIVYIDSEIRAMISNNASMEEIERYAIEKQGLVRLKDSGLQLLSDGVTTFEELVKIAYYN